MAVWSVPKLGTEMLEFFGPVLDSPELISDKKKWSLCALYVYYIFMLFLDINCGLGCCEAGNSHGFRFQRSGTEVDEGAVHGQPTHCFFFGLFLCVGLKTSM